MNRKLMVAMTLAVALMIPLTGCASKGKFSSAKLCAGAGGKYNQQTDTCDAPAQTGRKGSEMCQAHGGYWDPNARTCEIGMD
jgi:hypothetical protein